MDALLEAAPGVLLARMTGSGATCFGLFDEARPAARAVTEIARAHPGWWVCVTRLVENVEGLAMRCLGPEA